jgi:hypothetical protein
MKIFEELSGSFVNLVYCVLQTILHSKLRWTVLVFMGVAYLFTSFTSFLMIFYPVGFEDLLINQGFLSVRPQALITNTYAEKGMQKMKRSSVTIIGIARNVAISLPTILPQVELLGENFATSHVIFVEGDSSDYSRHLLNQWAAISPTNRTILESSSRHLRDTQGVFINKSLPREGRIAAARNVALNYLQHSLNKSNMYLKSTLSQDLDPVSGNQGQDSKYPNLDSRYLGLDQGYTIILDLDIIGFNLLGVADSLGRGHWDVMCATGIILFGRYRDVYALRDRTRGIVNNHHRSGDDHAMYGISEVERKINRRNYTVSMYTANNNSSAVQYSTWLHIDYRCVSRHHSLVLLPRYLGI